MFVTGAIASTEEVNLAWDSNSEEDMAGYEVWVRWKNTMTANCTADGVMIRDVTHQFGPATHTTSITLVWPDGEEGDWEIRVLAYDTSLNKSECSDEVSVRTDSKPPDPVDNFDAKIKEIVFDGLWERDYFRFA